MYLFCHSYYSLRYGTLPLEELIAQAASLGIGAMALTDINTTMGMIGFVRMCSENGIKPVAGVEFRNGDRLLYTGLARNNAGFRELNEMITSCNLNQTEYTADPGTLENVFVIYPYGSRRKEQLRENEFIGVRPGETGKLFTSEFSHDQSGLVMMHPVTFKDNIGYILHKNLRAIDHNTLISKLAPEQYAQQNEMMLPVDSLLTFYENYPRIIQNTEKLLEDCSIEFDYQRIKNKQTFTGSRYDDKILLEKLACDGLKYRYGLQDKVAAGRVRHELDIIDRLGFSAYFLITWDIIRYSMSRGFYHVGRGSGANSVVAYCLKITDVDPIDLDLYFERFINPRRTSPPDFDIDYSWDERGEVQDYIFKRYGHKHTALLGATSTFRGSSIYRELGKVYGLPRQEIDSLVTNPMAEVNKNEITRRIHTLAERLVDFPNIRSIHAGGVLISEEPLTCYTALDLPPKGFPTTQWDMYVAEELRYEKLDILSQRGIGHIKECAEIIAGNRGVKVDVHRVADFKQDEQVRKQLRTGETIGCFYIESPAMRGLLKKLRCDDYLTLVAASSIIRPGVAKSGMMREYIHRFHHPDAFSYIHPVMEQQLKETYGVMVYQEDVLKICHHFAGLDLADADVLRRAMSGKSRSRKEFNRIVEKFFANCKAFGYPDEISQEVWRQIESFAGYSFSKAHSASYAVESFQSLYLKAHYPLEFMVAVINNFGGFYHTWVYFNEARRQGAVICLPCVNNSGYKTSIREKEVYVGFIHIMNLEMSVGQAIAPERLKNGPYRDLEDFILRVPVHLEQMIILIRAGAFRFTGKGKAQLLWEAHLYFGKRKNEHPPLSLFCSAKKTFSLPQLDQTPVEDAYDEYELIGFPVTISAFDLLETPFRGEIMARQLSGNVGKKVRMLGRLVTIKYVRTVHKELMHFGTFLDVEGEFFDTVHFPDALRKYPFKGSGIYLILGTVSAEFDFPSLTVEKMAIMAVKKDPRG
ncbi:MAG TPA: DNA polymerase III subunit alpha [Bacteroidales bacterium]|nr:DNA polymerase III subunit alpha [Bacteroidales bacterium]HNS47648.1 DNA polymerase III subunit alpha [Bacteroidales bacterium]